MYPKIDFQQICKFRAYISLGMYNHCENGTATLSQVGLSELQLHYQTMCKQVNQLNLPDHCRSQASVTIELSCVLQVRVGGSTLVWSGKLQWRRYTSMLDWKMDWNGGMEYGMDYGIKK